MNNEITDRVKDLQRKELERENDEKVQLIRWTIGQTMWSDSLTAEQLEHVRQSVRTFIEWPGVGE